ncbi:hypothetical protein B0H13DRAFT_2649389, partial [Mycena leptocephala]
MLCRVSGSWRRPRRAPVGECLARTCTHLPYHFCASLSWWISGVCSPSLSYSLPSSVLVQRLPPSILPALTSYRFPSTLCPSLLPLHRIQFLPFCLVPSPTSCLLSFLRFVSYSGSSLPFPPHSRPSLEPLDLSLVLSSHPVSFIPSFFASFRPLPLFPFRLLLFSPPSSSSHLPTPSPVPSLLLFPLFSRDGNTRRPTPGSRSGPMGRSR